MAQPMAHTGEESTETWLPIIEYSIKSGVSLSTIRRRIKSNSIPYRLENGKYLILFQEGETVTATSTTNSATDQLVRNFSNVMVLRPAPAPKTPAPVPVFQSHSTGPTSPAPTREEPAAVRMLSDAYEHALKEKERRILLLEKHVRDQETRLEELKLLVGLLEEKYEVRY